MPFTNTNSFLHHLVKGSCVAALVFCCACAAAAIDPLASDHVSRRSNPKESLALGEKYLLGHGVPRDLERAAQLLRQAADAGDPVAQTRLGMMYHTGTGVPQDLLQAMHWYQLGASSGSLTAMVNMGLLYARGTGVRQDTGLAMQLFRDAYEKGCGLGAAYLGEMYFLGNGVRQDRAAAEKWFSKGMKMHDAIASYDLGILYTGQYGHAQNLSKAAQMFRRSAKVKYAPAQYSLGVVISRHPELGDFHHEALPSLQAASEEGFWKANALLGILSRDGDGLAKDQDAALYYFELAIAQGGETAEHLLGNDVNALTSRMAPEQVTEIASRANAWAKSHPRVFLFENSGPGQTALDGLLGPPESRSPGVQPRTTDAPPPA